ncbi:MAG: hypothetical protein ABJL55_10315 [Roseibium sp.]
MATCSMVLNNTSWKFSKSPCPFSSLEGSDINETVLATPLPDTKNMLDGIAPELSGAPNS